jgi:hypothetical protein
VESFFLVPARLQRAHPLYRSRAPPLV